MWMVPGRAESMDRDVDQSLSSIRGLQELPSNGLTRRRFLMTAGGSVGYLLLAACAGTSETTTTAAPATTAAQPASTTTAAPALSEVVFGLSGDPDTLDPHTTIAGNAWIALCNIFDGLTMLDYSSLEAPVPLIAGLAESWDISPDGTTYSFNLRQGVTFHDGTPWNSEAAVFNFRRWFDEGFEHYFEMANATVAGFIGGVESYEAASEYEFTVQLAEPNAGWFDYLGRAPTFYMVSPTAVQESGNDAFANIGVGTGPFAVESYERGSELVLVRNADYWGGAPDIERLIFVPVADEPTKVSGLVTGSFHIAQELTPDSIPQIEASPDLRIEFAGKPVTFGFAGHIGHEPWSDPRVREAFSLAINREAITDGLLRGAGVPASQFYGLGNSAYDPDLTPFPYDPDRAAALLSEAGVSDLVVNIKTSTSAMGVPTPGRILEQVQSDMLAVGIEMQIQILEWTSYLGEWFAGVPEPVPGEPIPLLSMAMGWDTNMLLGAYIGTGSFPTEGGVNYAWYSNEEVDNHLAATGGATSEEELIGHLRAAQRAMLADRPYIYIFHGLSPYGISNDLEWAPAAAWAQNLKLARGA